jgi:diacylglycerol kinase (ATP)
MKTRIHVVINPASGQPQPILHTLNRVFREAGVDWDISLTQESGDAERLARQAAASGANIVAAYGGDGTVMEVGQGLLNSTVPLAILPGGTANLMSVELGIPKDLAQAARIACDPHSSVRRVDVGQIGERYFLLRVSVGFGAKRVELADRQMKDKYGKMAYTIAGIKALGSLQSTKFRLKLDGQEIELPGLSALVDNAGNMGMAGVTPAKGISVSDGLLDMILITDAGFSSILDLGHSLVDRRLPQTYNHWQAKEIEIDCDPPQPVQVDGEIVGETPISIRILPQMLGVLVPAQE